MVAATIAYDPPGGRLGMLIAKLFQKEPKIHARRDLRRFKQLMETGEISASKAPDVARTGFEAMMKGEGDVVHGMKNKVQAAMAAVIPDSMLADQHRKQAEPGSGKAEGAQ